MGIALALWGWSPQAFRRCTPHEFWAAFEVFDESRQQPDRAGGAP
jgi:hypothetical protein